jgi:lipopolysaccharide transport system permease protein
MSPYNQSASLLNLIQLYLRHRQLTWEMIKRDITDRYAGQVFGPLWAIGHPLFLMAIYVIVFSYIFSMRIGASGSGFPLDYPTYILSGLIPWMAFQESMSRGTSAVLANTDLVKQVVFPLEILPIKGIFSAMLTQVVATLFLICYVLIKFSYLPLSYSLLPLLFFFQFLAMTGVSYVLASVGAYFRDLKDIVQVFSIACFYIIPILYLPSWMPKWFQPIFLLNPFSYMVWCYQDACFFGSFNHPWAWPAFFILSTLTFYLGYRVFHKLKTMFGNVL